MIRRYIQPPLAALSRQYPVTVITGPRQSGKTTLCRAVFKNKPYITLEDPDQSDFARSDPKGFLSRYPDGAVIDEIQRVPQLVSYIQGIVDARRKNGLYVLTGSQNLEISHTVSQSLAGRAAVLKLLPFSMGELGTRLNSWSLDRILRTGFYPRIHDQHLQPKQALGFYFETYIERDVRTLSHIIHLSLFRKFVRLCAGRVGQVLDISSLANDAGISHTTARQWLSVLEASYVVFEMQPYFRNFNKRIIRSPKLYFYDVGLAAFLLGIYSDHHMAQHPARGSLVENLAVVEFLKGIYNAVDPAELYYFRDSNGNEVDLLAQADEHLWAIEIKAGATVSGDYFKGLNYFKKTAGHSAGGRLHSAVFYGGEEDQPRSDHPVYSFRRLPAVVSRVYPIRSFGGKKTVPRG